MEINELYLNILRFAGLTADDKGFVSTLEKKEPVYIDKDRLVLPYPYQMRDNNDPDRIIFHPLADNILQGESKVIRKLKNNINVRLNQAVAILGQYLLFIASSKEIHPKLNPEQLRYVTSIDEVEEKAADKWGVLSVQLMKEAADRAFINVFLCRGGTIKGVKYARTGVTSFPLYEKMLKDQTDGTKELKIREMDRKPFRQLMEVMFPDINTAQQYDVGSHSNFAPYLQALLMTSAVAVFRINEILDVFEGVLEAEETKLIRSFTSELGWYEAISKMEDLGSEIRKFPPQRDGSVMVQTAAPTVVDNSPVPNPVAPVAPPVAAAQHIPAIVNQPPPAKTAEGLSIKGFLTSQNQYQPHQQQMMMNQPGQVMMQQVMTPQGPMMVPVQMAPQQMMPQQMVPQQMNPWMIQQAQQQMQQQQMQQTPTWAQVPPDQLMVSTQRGPMTQAIAMQLGLQWQPLQQQMQGQPNGRPSWG